MPAFNAARALAGAGAHEADVQLAQDASELRYPTLAAYRQPMPFRDDGIGLRT